MRDAVTRLLRELTLVTFALAIALGWSLIQVAEGVAQLVTGLLYDLGEEGEASVGGYFPFTTYSGVLAWTVWGRALTFGPLVAGLVQLGVVLAVAAVVYRRFRADTPGAGPHVADDD